MLLLKQSKNVLHIIAVGIFSIPAIFSLLRPGFFTSDDGVWMIIRFTAFYSSLADGQLPVRFLKGLNFGYGYPVANFLYPGFMYIATPIHLLGFGFVDSIKILLILSFILSGIFSFLWLKTLFGNLSAFLGATLYIYTPYHLFDLYKRGSVGELLAMVFVPLALYGIEKKNYYVVSISIFFIVVSHNSMALLFLPMILIYAFIRRKINVKNVYGIITGIMLSSFFILPAVFELGYTYFSKTSISNPLEYFVGVDLIGIVSIVLVIVASLLCLLRSGNSHKIKTHKGLFILFLLVSLISIFLSVPVSEFVWKTGVSAFLQFPFRILALLLVSNAFMGGYILDSLKGKTRIMVFVLLLFLTFYSAIKFLSPTEFTNIQDSVYATNPATTTVKNEYMPIWVSEFPVKQYESKVEVLDGVGVAQNLVEKSNNINFVMKNNTKTTIQLNTIYYPGWKAYVNNEEVNIKYDNPNGVMEISIPSGEQNIKFIFSETPLRIFANSVSLLAVLMLMSYPFLRFIKLKK